MNRPTAIEVLRSPRTIRERCQRVLDAGLAGDLTHFRVDLGGLAGAARRTAAITRARYPSLRVPPHGRLAHFDAGGVARVAAMEEHHRGADALERARCLTDVVVTSVLLDAGAGDAWRYREPESGLLLGRSEGLAVASLAWARDGGLSSRGHAYEVDAAGLLSVDAGDLARAFQVTESNPLVGVEGRVHLLRALGQVLMGRPDVFGATLRVGGLVDTLRGSADGGRLPAASILAAMLDVLSPIWPGRIRIEGEPLGDVWSHPWAGGEGATAGLVPFHKLSQWLSYSLFVPLEVAGLSIVEPEALTGLAEYRNGGLLVDTGVLALCDGNARQLAHPVDSELVVEFRALTVALLDLLAPLVRSELGLSEPELPLASVLEGGTWAAGRAIAAELRDGGGPPFPIISDGTVF